jgi:hypothetical protein
MVPSAQPALFAFLRSVRLVSLGRNLRAFILRCLLLCPRILHSLRKVWSRYFQTSSSDEKKTKGDTGEPPSTGTVQKREECEVVCASQDFGEGGEPSWHPISGSSNAEQSIQLEDVIRRTPSVPHTLSSSYAPSPSPRGSPRHWATRLPSGSPHTSASSLRAEDPLAAMELFLGRSNTPVSWTHSRATGRQFTRASSRSRSRPSSPSLRHFPRPYTPTKHDIDISTRPTMIQYSQGSPEGSISEVPIQLEQPSRPASPEDTQSSMYSPPRPRLSPVHDRTQSLPTSHQLPSTVSVNSSSVSSHSRGHSPSMYGEHIGAHQSRGNIQNFVTSQSTQVSTGPSFPLPEPFVSLISESTQISTTIAPISPSQPDTRVRQMTSDQVSRYVKKGDVCVLSVTLATSFHRDIHSGHVYTASLS